MLNDAFIRSIKPPERGQRSYADESLPGFALRISQGGTKSFVLVYGRARTRKTIGRYPIISLSQARARAKEILAEITLGTHKPKSLTFQDAFELYKAHKLPQNRASTAKETERLLTKAGRRFGLSQLSDITTPDLAAFLDRYVETNPLAKLQKQRAAPRDRVLSLSELRSVLEAAETFGRYGQLIRFLIYTGVRLSNATGLTEAHIDRDKMTLSWPGSEMKTGRPHSIPYGLFTSQLLMETNSPVSLGTIYIVTLELGPIAGVKIGININEAKPYT